MPEVSATKITIADATAEPVPAATSTPRAPRPSARAPGKDPTVHEHPSSVVGVILGKDSDGRRVTGYAPGRVPTYWFNCKACQTEDRKRMSEPSALDEVALETTLFLVPEPVHYDARIARVYLGQRYPEQKLEVSHQFNPHKLAFVRGAQIVVLTRRGAGPSSKRQLDEENKFEDIDIPPETYVNQIIESAPVKLDDCITQVAATMYSDAQADMTELVARLSELAFPYRIAIPADPKDSMFIMRQNA